MEAADLTFVMQRIGLVKLLMQQRKQNKRYANDALAKIPTKVQVPLFG